MVAAREVRGRLEGEGIETRAFFIPIHRQPVYQGGHRRWPDLRGLYPVSDELGQKGFYLPSGLNLTRDEQVRIVEQLSSANGDRPRRSLAMPLSVLIVQTFYPEFLKNIYAGTGTGGAGVRVPVR